MYPCIHVHILGNKIKTNLNEGHNVENQTEMKEEKKIYTYRLKPICWFMCVLVEWKTCRPSWPRWMVQ